MRRLLAGLLVAAAWVAVRALGALDDWADIDWEDDDE